MNKYLYTILITLLLIVVNIMTIDSVLLGPTVLFCGVVMIGCFIVLDFIKWISREDIRKENIEFLLTYEKFLRECGKDEKFINNALKKSAKERGIRL